jgi:PhnB protein
MPQKELAFVKQRSAASEAHVSRDPSGRIAHAQLAIGDSVVTMAPANEQWLSLLAAIYVYLPDVDSAYNRALAANAISTMQPADQFYGDPTAGVKNSNGVHWWIATHIEDVSSEELPRRASDTS